MTKPERRRRLVAPVRGRRHNIRVSAEQLIGLEAAIAELGTLYATAGSYAPLRERAEAELLPRLTTLGSRLRRLVRTARLGDDEIGGAAREILALAAAWRAELERVREGAPYRAALAAFAADRQEELAQLIPEIFAGLEPLRPAPALFFPVSLAVSGRRRAGRSPFLAAAACAERIVGLLDDGLAAAPEGTDWWDRELAPIDCAADAAALDSPIALRLAAADIRVAVFAAAAQPGLRVFTPCLRVPFTVVLAAEANDEWWEAYEDSYRTFRDAVQRELAARARVAVIAAGRTAA